MRKLLETNPPGYLSHIGHSEALRTRPGQPGLSSWRFSRRGRSHMWKLLDVSLPTAWEFLRPLAAIPCDFGRCPMRPFRKFPTPPPFRTMEPNAVRNSTVEVFRQAKV